MAGSPVEAIIGHVVLEHCERLRGIGGLANGDEVEIAACCAWVSSIIFHQLRDEPALCLSIVEAPWIAEEWTPNAGRPVNLCSQPKKGVHIFNTDEDGSSRGVHLDDVVYRLDYEAITGTKPLVWRFEAELISTIRQSLIHMAQSVEPGKSKPLKTNHDASRDVRFRGRKCAA